MPKLFADRPIPEPFLTTGDVARYCHTNVTQVKRWIQKGDLEALQTPGGHYRITKEKFRLFLEKNNIPVIEEFFKETKKKILIADDDAVLVDAFKNALEENIEDIEIETAFDGYETLIKTGNFMPDILILDIKMPKIDGLEVCQRLRKDKNIIADIKILAITGHSEAYDRETVLSAGADEYLLKPIDKKKLIEHVEKLI